MPIQKQSLAILLSLAVIKIHVTLMDMGILFYYKILCQDIQEAFYKFLNQREIHRSHLITIFYL